MRVVYSTQSKTDLKDIANWISEESIPAAKRMIAKLQERCADLRAQPQRFPTLNRRSAIRRRVVDAYIIFYLILDDHVQIVRILHGARNYIDIFEQDDPA